MPGVASRVVILFPVNKEINVFRRTEKQDIV